MLGGKETIRNISCKIMEEFREFIQSNGVIKMIRTILIFIIITSLYSCKFKSESNQKKDNKELIVIKKDNDSLSILANTLKLYYNSDYDKFFELFPNDFTSFNKLYGYNDKKGEGLLYSNYETHLNYLFKDNEADLLNKCVSLSINGEWDADAINVMQNFTRNLVIAYPNKTLTFLEKYTENEVYSFWNFIFDGPHPEDEHNLNIYNTIYSEISEIDKGQSELIKSIYLSTISKK